eukprot:s1104_g31.t1
MHHLLAPLVGIYSLSKMCVFPLFLPCPVGITFACCRAPKSWPSPAGQVVPKEAWQQSMSWPEFRGPDQWQRAPNFMSWFNWSYLWRVKLVMARGSHDAAARAEIAFLEQGLKNSNNMLQLMNTTSTDAQEVVRQYRMICEALKEFKDNFEPVQLLGDEVGADGEFQVGYADECVEKKAKERGVYFTNLMKVLERFQDPDKQMEGAKAKAPRRHRQLCGRKSWICLQTPDTDQKALLKARQQNYAMDSAKTLWEQIKAICDDILNPLD